MFPLAEDSARLELNLEFPDKCRYCMVEVLPEPSLVAQYGTGTGLRGGLGRDGEVGKLEAGLGVSMDLKGLLFHCGEAMPLTTLWGQELGEVWPVPSSPHTSTRTDNAL